MARVPGNTDMIQEITEVDVEKIKAELAHRKYVLRPQLHEEVKRTREYGDLSENDEYRCAKRERNQNESRIRYLDHLLATARVVKVAPKGDTIGLFDTVEYLNERSGAVRKIQLVTATRQDALHGYISKESPLGRAMTGHRPGDRVLVEIAPGNTYYITIRTVEHGEDNADLPIKPY